MMGLFNGEDGVILARFVLLQYQLVTDGQTGGLTDSTMAIERCIAVTAKLQRQKTVAVSF